MMTERTRPMFRVSNKHATSCGKPPFFDGDAKTTYHSYFENEHGDQSIYTYDYNTGVARLRMGDAGWDNTYTVVDGGVDGLVLTKSEDAWLNACWLATGALRK